MRAGAIDIGTNTLLMLIADIDHGLRVISDHHRIARLGEKVKETKVISDEACGRAKSILADYRSICQKHNVEKLRICGTSALRDAVNRIEIIEELSTVIQHPIELISGEEEASLSYFGSIEKNDNNLLDNNFLIDIGGGSTELIVGTNESILFKNSIDIGAVKITEMFFDKHPPEKNKIKLANEYVFESLTDIQNNLSNHTIYAVAGTPTTIAAVSLGLKEFDSEKIDGYFLTIEELDKCIQIFCQHDVEDLVKKYHIHQGRADLILAGSLILMNIFTKYSINGTLVSTKGLRYGIMKSMMNN